MARSWRGRGAGHRQCVAWVARAWCGHGAGLGAGLSCDPWGSEPPAPAVQEGPGPPPRSRAASTSQAVAEVETGVLLSTTSFDNWHELFMATLLKM
eukprot:gene16246-biopygen729